MNIEIIDVVPSGCLAVNGFLAACTLLAMVPFANAQNVSFVAQRDFAIGDTAFSNVVGAPIAADFNGDGKPDLAVSVSGLGAKVFIGNGDGTFQSPQVATLALTGNFAEALAVGDFDGDGKVDLALLASSSTVSVMLGNGDGTFKPAKMVAQLSGGLSVVSIIAADLDLDGNLDLAIVSTDAVSLVGSGLSSFLVLMGKGDGSFQAAASFKINGPSSPFRSLAVADFDGDGKPDLAIANGSDTISLMLGNGDGTFQPAIDVPVGGVVYQVAVGDVNGDGRPDLIASGFTRVWALVAGIGGPSYFQAPQVSFAEDDGQQPTLLPNAPLSAGIGDFNGDGIPDLAVGSALTGVHVLQGIGDGTFRNPADFAQPQLFENPGDQPSVRTAGLVVSDLNGDGLSDIAMTNGWDNIGVPRFVSVLLGGGELVQGALRTKLVDPNYISRHYPSSIAAADFSGNGKLGLAVELPSLVASNGCAQVLMTGIGEGRFSQQSADSGDGEPCAEAGVAAINVGGKMMAAFLELAVELRSFGPGSSVGYGAGYPSGLLAADVNGDGIQDLVVDVYNPSRIAVALGNGAGRFGAPLFSDAGSLQISETSSLSVADFNGDGKPDLVLASGSSVSVWLGTGTGTFRSPVVLADLSTVFLDQFFRSVVATADFNGDGKMDIVVATDVSFLLFLGNGDGTFRQQNLNHVGGYSLALGDFNGDGKKDLAFASGNRISVLLGNGDGTFSQQELRITGSLKKSRQITGCQGRLYGWERSTRPARKRASPPRVG